MEEVQKCDCIWNKYSKSYRDKYIKMNCWAKIGEKFDMSAADAEKKNLKCQDWLREVSEESLVDSFGIWQGCCSRTQRFCRP